VIELSPRARQLAGYFLIGIGAIAVWLFFRHRAPVHDVAWLVEGTRRWMNGAALYVDIRELNPPLIFYDTLLLSGGTATNSAFVAGIAVATLISSLWVARHHGEFVGFGTLVSITFAGMVGFGQREHLLLIFVAPYLLARGPRWERVLMGVWAFLGVGLKPYFLLVIILPAAVEAWRNRSSVFDAQKVTLAACCVLYVVATYLLYPVYFREIVPLGAATYFAYGASLPPLIIFETVVILAFILFADRDRRAFAAAVLGALLCYYLQGRFWWYHFIPAAGLGMMLCFWQRRIAGWTALLLVQAIYGPYVPDPHPAIPQGVSRVVVMSAHVYHAYPGVTGCGAVNETPWGSLGWLPGAWNTVTDPSSSTAEKRKAWQILRQERQRLRDFIRDNDVQLIIADVAPDKQYFKGPFDYMRFFGPLPEYKLVRRIGRFEYWAKVPLSPHMCREHY